ncbi:MAG: hypothetical protein BGO86_05870 [Chryseobacterium sp. 36-9]|nr:MAG: hypothetical protein BGO86_05870 [Chryseobacterium sp. 36-9]
MKSIAFTLVNIAYLPVAKTLADSFILHNPDIPFYICLFDDQKNIKDPVFLDYNIYDKNKLDLKEYDSMRERYSNLSMACALKPYFAEQLIKDSSAESVIYLDADTKVFDKLDTITGIFDTEESSIILTGHNYKVVKDSREVIFNAFTRKYGIFNAGFFAVKNTKAGNEFLNWWKRMLFEYCVQDEKKGILYDQTWLDLATLYFNKELHILDHLGYNVAFWNLKEREISRNGNRYFINDSIPLVFYHFARYNYYNSEFVDGYSQRLVSYPILQEIFEIYRIELKENLFENYIKETKTTIKDIPQKIKNRIRFYLEILTDKL